MRGPRAPVQEGEMEAERENVGRGILVMMAPGSDETELPSAIESMEMMIKRDKCSDPRLYGGARPCGASHGVRRCSFRLPENEPMKRCFVPAGFGRTRGLFVLKGARAKEKGEDLLAARLSSMLLSSTRSRQLSWGDIKRSAKPVSGMWCPQLSGTKSVHGGTNHVSLVRFEDESEKWHYAILVESAIDEAYHGLLNWVTAKCKKSSEKKKLWSVGQFASSRHYQAFQAASRSHLRRLALDAATALGFSRHLKVVEDDWCKEALVHQPHAVVPCQALPAYEDMLGGAVLDSARRQVLFFSDASLVGEGRQFVVVSAGPSSVQLAYFSGSNAPASRQPFSVIPTELVPASTTDKKGYVAGRRMGRKRDETIAKRVFWSNESGERIRAHPALTMHAQKPMFSAQGSALSDGVHEWMRDVAGHEMTKGLAHFVVVASVLAPLQ